MALKAFDDGREYEGLVRQLNAIFEEIDRAKDREARRGIFKHILDDIYPKIYSFEEKYGVDRAERGHNAHIHACCVDEKFYLGYKEEQEQFRKEIHATG